MWHKPIYDVYDFIGGDGRVHWIYSGGNEIHIGEYDDYAGGRFTYCIYNIGTGWRKATTPHYPMSSLKRGQKIQFAVVWLDSEDDVQNMHIPAYAYKINTYVKGSEEGGSTGGEGEGEGGEGEIPSGRPGNFSGFEFRSGESMMYKKINDRLIYCYPVKAVEWSRFCDKVNEFREYKGLGKAYMADYKREENFTADIYNRVVRILNEMLPPNQQISEVLKDITPITAYRINVLQTRLNSIE